MKEAILVPTEASGKDIAEVPRERNPLTLIHAARYSLEALRLYLSPSDDWRTPLRVDIARAFALDDLWLVGQIVARLTVLVESCGSADPDLFLDLADGVVDLQELRDEIAARRSPNEELRAAIRENRRALSPAERRASRPRSDEGAGVLPATAPVGTAPREHASAEGARQ